MWASSLGATPQDLFELKFFSCLLMMTLQQQLAEKCIEAVALEAEISRAKFEARQLTLQLDAHGVHAATLIPDELRSGGGHRHGSADVLAGEHKRIIEWLSDSCDPTQQALFFNAPGDAKVGDYTVSFGRMVQWPLSAPGSLKLNVPQELESDLRGMLVKAKRRLLDASDVRTLSQDWAIVGTELTTPDGGAEPAIFLIHRSTSQAVVVGTWPQLGITLPPPRTSDFNAGAFFGASHPPEISPTQPVSFQDDSGTSHSILDEEGTLQWITTDGERCALRECGLMFNTNDQCIISGPRGAVTIADPAPGWAQRELMESLMVLALEHGVRIWSGAFVPAPSPAPAPCPGPTSAAPLLANPTSATPLPASPTDTTPLPTSPTSLPVATDVSAGDQVEVEYDGEWFSGVLQLVEGEVAHVQCDVDPPHLVTLAPLRNVRRVLKTRPRSFHMRTLTR